jgi:hypothetical protein
MTHLRRYDIASIKCYISIFHVDNVSQYRYIRKHFRRRWVAIIDIPWSCERGRYLAGNESDYKVGPGSPPLHTRLCKGQSGNPGGRSRKSLVFSPIPKIRLATADQCSHQNPVTPAKEAVIQLRTWRRHSQYPSFPRKREPHEFQSLAPGVLSVCPSLRCPCLRAVFVA